MADDKQKLKPATEEELTEIASEVDRAVEVGFELITVTVLQTRGLVDLITFLKMQLNDAHDESLMYKAGLEDGKKEAEREFWETKIETVSNPGSVAACIGSLLAAPINPAFGYTASSTVVDVTSAESYIDGWRPDADT